MVPTSYFQISRHFSTEPFTLHCIEIPKGLFGKVLLRLVKENF